MNQAKNMQLSWSQLKLIAYITMLIDHTAHILLQNGIMVTYPQCFPYVKPVMILMRGIGRIAFPIFSFLLVEGLIHTRSRVKYLLRILLLAIISEPVFDYANNGVFYYADYQNVFITLLIAATTMCVLSLIEQNNRLNKNIYVLYVLQGIVVIVGCFLAEFLKVDYGMSGIIIPLIMGVIRRLKLDSSSAFAIYFVATIIARVIRNIVNAPTYILNPEMWYEKYLMYTINNLQIFAILALIPIFMYDGTKGKPMPKAVYYLFYPVHLSILGLICYQLIR
ncbi:MAG: TraX family protein [Lachnospiraceae bacterium]|nr:TraX family protein [Lachnospiraceae bacterium]